jgi:hypothetical protein
VFVPRAACVIETMKKGHAEFYASGYLQICKVICEIGPFKHS